MPCPDGAGFPWLDVVDEDGIWLAVGTGRAPDPWPQPVVRTSATAAVASRAARRCVMISPLISAVPDKHALTSRVSDTGGTARLPQEFEELRYAPIACRTSAAHEAFGVMSEVQSQDRVKGTGHGGGGHVGSFMMRFCCHP